MKLTPCPVMIFEDFFVEIVILWFGVIVHGWLLVIVESSPGVRFNIVH